MIIPNSGASGACAAAHEKGGRGRKEIRVVLSVDNLICRQNKNINREKGEYMRCDWVVERRRVKTVRRRKTWVARKAGERDDIEWSAGDRRVSGSRH